MRKINKLISNNIRTKYQLPLKLISLNNWSLITVTGIDATKYLQSKFTTDITNLTLQQHIFTAHCNAKGKILSTLRLFHYNNGYGYILRSSVAETQLNELKKYAVFSQITLKKHNNIVLLGVIGQDARNILNNHFYQLPNQENPVIHLKEITLLHFSEPSERFLLILNNEDAVQLTKYFPKNNNGQEEWLALDIAAGIANIDVENSVQFIPQAINLQAFPNSISFQKNCYSGQEVIAKAQYRGINKRAMFWLYGTANTLPKIGESIEWKIGNNWRRTGIVLAAVKLTKGFISIQIVMNNNIPKESIFRVPKEDKSQLTIKPLPYLLK